jgi:hypothetical protein
LIGARFSRSRKFTPRRLFQALTQLVSGSNGEGYRHALVGTFGLGLDDRGRLKMPTPGALSQMRARVSYRFFQEHFEKLVGRFHAHRARWRGMLVLAIDGLELEIPRTKAIHQAGYRGRAVSQYRDTHYPRLYLTHCYDVLSEVTHSFTHHSHPGELKDPQKLLRNVERGSLVMYDRLYPSRGMLRAHRGRGVHFLMRVRRGWLTPVEKFFESPKKRTFLQIEGVKVTLIKIPNPKKPDEPSVFITDLPRAWVTEPIVRDLYSKRWQVETSFRELIQTIRIEQWHSKSENGILQELYAAFWLLNFTQMQIFHRRRKPENPIQRAYERPSLKLIYDWIRDRLAALFQGMRAFLDEIAKLIKISTQRRKRLHRSYPRRLRMAAPLYPYENVRWVWEGLN